MSLSFTNPVQQLTYTKVSEYLSISALFKNNLKASLDQPKFEITYGSALVEVEVQSWDVHPWETADLAIVKASSCVTVGSRINSELMSYLLSENRRMRFGTFCLGEANLREAHSVWFAHSVLGGENMDLLELQTCILSVVTIADTYDDLIVERFGGQRGVDRILPLGG
ncbi:MAG: T3SS (YopN, CesT) and YbjN peptide-binding chaperone 1 [Elainella sp.]